MVQRYEHCRTEYSSKVTDCIEQLELYGWLLQQTATYKVPMRRIEVESLVVNYFLYEILHKYVSGFHTQDYLLGRGKNGSCEKHTKQEVKDHLHSSWPLEKYLWINDGWMNKRMEEWLSGEWLDEYIDACIGR